jgi:thioredoxin-related protein
MGRGTKSRFSLPAGAGLGILLGLGLIWLTVTLPAPALGDSPGDLDPRLAVLDLEKALSAASEEKKHTFIYFWTPACPYCQRFTEEVLTDTDVIDLLRSDFVVVSINADQERRLSRSFRVAGVPYLVFLDSQGQLASIVPGAMPADFFLVLLEYVRTKSYTETEFSEFVEALSERAD